jgi:hypothetical protein
MSSELKEMREARDLEILEEFNLDQWNLDIAKEHDLLKKAAEEIKKRRGEYDRAVKAAEEEKDKLLKIVEEQEEDELEEPESNSEEELTPLLLEEKLKIKKEQRQPLELKIMELSNALRLLEYAYSQENDQRQKLLDLKIQKLHVERQHLHDSKAFEKEKEELDQQQRELNREQLARDSRIQMGRDIISDEMLSNEEIEALEARINKMKERGKLIVGGVMSKRIHAHDVAVARQNESHRKYKQKQKISKDALANLKVVKQEAEVRNAEYLEKLAVAKKDPSKFDEAINTGKILLDKLEEMLELEELVRGKLEEEMRAREAFEKVKEELKNQAEGPPRLLELLGVRKKQLEGWSEPAGIAELAKVNERIAALTKAEKMQKEIDEEIRSKKEELQKAIKFCEDNAKLDKEKIDKLKQQMRNLEKSLEFPEGEIRLYSNGLVGFIPEGSKEILLVGYVKNFAYQEEDLHIRAKAHFKDIYYFKEFKVFNPVDDLPYLAERLTIPFESEFHISEDEKYNCKKFLALANMQGDFYFLPNGYVVFTPQDNKNKELFIVGNWEIKNNKIKFNRDYGGSVNLDEDEEMKALYPKEAITAGSGSFINSKVVESFEASELLTLEKKRAQYDDENPFVRVGAHDWKPLEINGWNITKGIKETIHHLEKENIKLVHHQLRGERSYIATSASSIKNLESGNVYDVAAKVVETLSALYGDGAVIFNFRSERDEQKFSRIFVEKYKKIHPKAEIILTVGEIEFKQEMANLNVNNPTFSLGKKIEMEGLVISKAPSPTHCTRLR